MTVHERARSYLAADRPAEAVRVLSEHLAHRPDDAAAWDDAAEALLRLGQAGAAIDAAVQLHRLTGSPEAASLVALTLALAGRAEEALQIVESVVQLGTTARGWERIARALDAVGALEPALDARRRARQLAPGDQGLALRLAEALERADHREEARALAMELLSGDRSSCDVHRLLVRLDHHDDRLEEAAIRARRLLASQRLSPPAARGLWMELARIEARSGEVDRAWQAAGAGNAMALGAWAAAPGADPDRLPGHLDQLLALEPGPLPPAMDPPPPVAFIIGFPRSGTTLVQQILEAHPQTVTLDEAPLMDEAMAEALPELDPAGALRRLTDPDQAARLRDAWWSAAQRRVEPGERLIVDKLPLNLLRIDLIARALPGAAIVAVIRDPRDAVLSAYFQDFNLNEAMSQCAEISRCAALYARAMSLWLRIRDQLPRAIELRYEALVSDPEATIRPALAGLGLPWHDAVLSHHHSARSEAIRTPSYRDVRRPLYTRSLGRWRPFAEHLAPVLPTLQPYVEALGYPP
ncbi:MAG TPA: hypothetical protein ENK18_01430 [Deltaproteobacteria bacterium]|nr:hypothetical protein [Deltaproteobacteria bacterium]